MAKAEKKVVTIEDRVKLLEIDVANIINALDDVPRNRCVKASFDEKVRFGLIDLSTDEDQEASVKEAKKEELKKSI